MENGDASKKIRNLRLSLGMSKAELARHIPWDRTVISRVENGHLQDGKAAERILWAVRQLVDKR